MGVQVSPSAHSIATLYHSFYKDVSLETQFRNLEGCKREVVIEMTKADLAPHFEKAYQKAQPEIEIKGFRKGKVPLNLVKQKFGKQIENNAVEDIASEVFTSLVRGENIRPVGQPRLTDLQRDPEGGLKITISYEILPEFELGEYRGLVVDKLVHTMTDEEVDNEIDRILLEHGTLEDAEQIDGDNYVASVQFRKIDAETGMPLIGGESETMEVFLGNKNTDANLKASLLNAKLNDSFRYEVRNAPEGGQPIPFHATVTKIQRIVPAEFTNDFVENLTQGTLTSTEELRDEIERQLKEMWDNRSRQMLDDTLVNKLLDAHEFDIPSSLVSEVLMSYVEDLKQRQPDKKLPKNFDMQSFGQQMLPLAVQSAKWMIIRERIIETEELKVEDADLDRFIQGLPNLQVDAEQLRAFVENDPQVQSRLLGEKAMDLVRDYAIVTEVEDTAVAHAHNHDHDHDHDHDHGH